MEAKIFKVISKSAVTTINANGRSIPKCTIVLQEPDRYGNVYLATMLGEEAQASVIEGDYVAAVLRFSLHDYEGRQFQDITVNSIVRIGISTGF